MNREKNVQLSADLNQRIKNALQAAIVIHIRRPMQRNQRKAIRKTVLRKTPRSRQSPHESIDHHVAHKVNPLASHAFFEQIRVAIFRRSKQQIREAVSNNAIHFLRHSAIEGAKPSLNVRYRHKQLRTNQGSSK